MDGDRFDQLSRAVAAGVSRRRMLAGVAAAVLGAVGGRRAPGASAQVTQAQCGNVVCAKDPVRCGDGCVCCGYRNARGNVTNSRCRPAGQCGPGAVLCPPGLTFSPELGRCAACLGDGDCGAGTICCDGACVAGSNDDPTNCGCARERCPVNETCVAGRCGCDGSSAVAPNTCCPPTSGSFSACAFPGENVFVVADTCATVFECPEGYAACVGVLGDPNELYDTCQACCPPGATCDPLGFCRQ